MNDASCKYHEIAKYIEAEASNPILDTNMLADIFKINRSWISKNFREVIGTGISDYIVKCRITMAKELLKIDM